MNQPAQPLSDNFEEGAPLVDSNRIESFYGIIETMHVELDADPLEFGPKRMNEKIAAVRALLTKCERVSLEVSQDLHWYRRRHRLATAVFALKVQELLANDPEVRSGRNVTDREAIAGVKLRPDKEVIDRLNNAVEDLEAVLTVVKTKRADLKDIQARLKDQLKVCQEEISLGSRWGSRRTPPKTQVAGGKGLTVVKNGEETSLEDMMEGVLAGMGQGGEGEDTTGDTADFEAPVALITKETPAEPDFFDEVNRDVTPGNIEGDASVSHDTFLSDITVDSKEDRSPVIDDVNELVDLL